MNQLTQKFLIVIALAIIVLLPRVFNLDQFLAADEKRWLANVTGFTMALAHFQWDNLVQQPHPGITTQWLGAPTVFHQSWTVRKLPLVIAQSVLIFLTGYVFFRLWGKVPALLLIVILALNPFLIAHTRVYAMDSLLSHFLLLSVALLLLWDKTQYTRYLIFSAIAGALAVLSKLPGIIIVPAAIGYITYTQCRRRTFTLRHTFAWIVVFCITLPVILPSLATNFINVMQDFIGFFHSENYISEHTESKLYYIRTITFFSTPLQFLSIALLPFIWKKINRKRREQILMLILSAVAFVLMMSLGSKMGDRYILPAFLFLDAIAAVVFATTITVHNTNRFFFLCSIFFFLSVSIQALDVWRLHPYTLSYVNPVTKPFFCDRRLGWGEGLDIAAKYLNEKGNANNLKVASYYPSEFSTYFKGETTALHNWDSGTIDYAVLYRAQYERGANAWETDVLQQFHNKTPEKIIYLNGLEYVWIYKLL